MKTGSTVFLRIVIVLIALGVLTAIIRFPQTEGRATGLDLMSIYTDPFIIYMYIASIPFFIALLQAFKLLGYIDKNKIFSQIAIRAVRNIKYCAITIIGFILGAQAFLFIVERGKSDDIAGGVAMGIFIIVASLIVVATADIFEKLLQKAM